MDPVELNPNHAIGPSALSALLGQPTLRIDGLTVGGTA